jgi:hypothetical protein
MSHVAGYLLVCDDASLFEHELMIDGYNTFLVGKEDHKEKKKKIALKGRRR